MTIQTSYPVEGPASCLISWLFFLGKADMAAVAKSLLFICEICKEAQGSTHQYRKHVLRYRHSNRCPTCNSQIRKVVLRSHSWLSCGLNQSLERDSNAFMDYLLACKSK